MVEIWKKISWAVDYEVSNLGNVRSSKYGTARLLKPTMKKGYYTVCIRAENTIKQATLHRLVADAFVPNPYGYTIVNHKDENKTNNNANNLEWCTPQYNVTYKNAHKKSEEKHKKKVFKYSINGEYICSYNSMIEAENETKAMYESISRSCRKIITTAGGYVWRWYKKENIANEIIHKYTVQRDLKGNIVSIYYNVSIAAKQNGYSKGNISEVCRGNKETAYGYKWNYEYMYFNEIDTKLYNVANKRLYQEPMKAQLF